VAGIIKIKIKMSKNIPKNLKDLNMGPPF